jgi:prepilin-type N-terminal cleavage/methylation domain-containing protein
MKKFLKRFRYGQKGFTLIELLVVIGILGAIAAIVVPNVGQFIGRGKTESYETELHNVETSVMAMLVDDADSTLDSVPVGETTDMSQITGTNLAGDPLLLSEYITGLAADDPTTLAVENADPPVYVKLGCKYIFTTDGQVTQIKPGE